MTAGVPSAFHEPARAQDVANKVARLAGCEQGILGASTLHLFWDLFGIFARQPVRIFFDSGLYPIGRWGVERAAGLGAPVHQFRHHDAQSLRRFLESDPLSQLQPILVTDGYCPNCGNPAPLADYVRIGRAHGCRLIVDDTQALGIFGHSRRAVPPFGLGGGGTLRSSGLSGPDILVISSLAKAFGVPLAVLSGSRAAIREFAGKSATRVHCSPPAVPSIRAAEHALAVNETRGDQLRFRLASLVARFRAKADDAHLSMTGGLFPVQTFDPASRSQAVRIHQQLQRAGIGTVLRTSPTHANPRISFLINARHTRAQIDHAITALADISSAGNAQSTLEASFSGRSKSAGTRLLYLP